MKRLKYKTGSSCSAPENLLMGVQLQTRVGQTKFYNFITHTLQNRGGGGGGGGRKIVSFYSCKNLRILHRHASLMSNFANFKVIEAYCDAPKQFSGFVMQIHK